MKHTNQSILSDLLVKMAGSEGESDIAVTYNFTPTLIQQTRDTILPVGLGSEPSREAARRAA